MLRLQKLFLILSVLLGVITFCVGGCYLYILHHFDKPGPLKNPVIVLVEKGSGISDIATQLRYSQVISDVNIFTAGVWIEGETRSLKAGEYKFLPGISPRKVMNNLLKGNVIEHTITFPEGITSAAIITQMKSTNTLIGEVKTLPNQGSLLPETYSYRHGYSRGLLIKRMKIAMEVLLDELWSKRVKDLPFDNPMQALILASIVEMETGIASERAIIAGVFINRLKLGMPLQSDPTVIYAITEGKRILGRKLLRSDLNIDSPFNTYRKRGLPPEPITNPGREALFATLNPAITDAIYFVADGSGGHAFSTNLNEHRRNVARWRALRK